MKLNKPITQMTGTDIVNLAKSIDRKTWIKIGAGAFAAVLIINFLVLPAWFKRSEVRSKIAAIEGQIIRLQTLRRKEKGWLQEKDASAKYIQNVKDRLFVSGETSLLLGKLAKFADESNVDVIASTPRGEGVDMPKPYNERYKAELYDFTIEGGYHELAQFISRIESHSKILRVEMFQISPREKNPERHWADLTLSAVSHREEK